MPQGGGCGAAPSAEPAVAPVKRCDVTGCVWRSVWSMGSIREDRPSSKHALIYGAVSDFQSGSRRKYPWARSSTRSRAVCATSGSIRLASDAEPLWIVYVLCMSVITVTVALFSLMCAGVRGSQVSQHGRVLGRQGGYRHSHDYGTLPESQPVT
jgi:hypothetical protein